MGVHHDPFDGRVVQAVRRGCLKNPPITGGGSEPKHGGWGIPISASCRQEPLHRRFKIVRVDQLEHAPPALLIGDEAKDAFSGLIRVDHPGLVIDHSYQIARMSQQCA